MRRFILLVVVFLLVASLAGDVFFVHHHIGDFSLETEHTAPQCVSYVLTDFTDMRGGGGGLLFASNSCCPGSDINGGVGCFCGWYSSAYLDEVAAAVHHT